MKKIFLMRALILPVLFIFFAADFAQAQTDKKFSTDFEGFFRNRYEYFVNSADAGFSGKDEKSYFRFKFSGAAEISYGNLVSAYIRFTSESRSYIKNAGKPAAYDINEIAADNFFILFAPLCGALEIKAGRMDLRGAQYAEGFLLDDGTPLDGSRTFYFNGAGLKYRWRENRIEMLAFYNPEKDFLPVINGKDRRLNSADETGAALFAGLRVCDEIYFEPYYVWKKAENAQDKLFAGKTLTNAFGSFVKYKSGKLSVKAQAALQIGEYDGKAGLGYGGYLFADYSFSAYAKPQAGIMYLSGDNAGTERQEGWNPLFSRGAYMSEIAASLYSYESGYGCWTNLLLYNIEMQSKPFDKLTLKATYMHLKANENVSGAIFAAGKTRGNLIMCKAAFGFSENLSASVSGEYFIPGGFYYKGAKDAVFLRAEAVFKI